MYLLFPPTVNVMVCQSDVKLVLLPPDGEKEYCSRLYLLLKSTLSEILVVHRLDWVNLPKVDLSTF